MSQNVAQIDKLLTAASNGYFPNTYIADEILPVLKSKQTTGKLGKYGTDFLRIENSIISGEGKYRKIKPITRSTDSYSMEGHGLTDMVTQEDYDNVDKPFEAENDTTLGLTHLLKIEREFSLASVLGDTAILTQNLTLAGTDQWSDYTNSDPMGDIVNALLAVVNGCGFGANKAIMDEAVAITISRHPAILDKLGYKYNRTGALTKQELALALGVDKVMISAVRYESAKEGQTSVIAPVWGKNIVFLYAPDVAMPRQKSLGYRIQRDKKAPYKVYKNPVFNPPGAKDVLVENWYDDLLADVKCAYLLKAVIA